MTICSRDTSTQSTHGHWYKTSAMLSEAARHNQRSECNLLTPLTLMGPYVCCPLASPTRLCIASTAVSLHSMNIVLDCCSSNNGPHSRDTFACIAWDNVRPYMSSHHVRTDVFRRVTKPMCNEAFSQQGRCKKPTPSRKVATV